MAKPAPERNTLLVIRASLKPRVYRDIEIEGRESLYVLAAAIVRAFNFGFDDHMFGFFSQTAGNFWQSPVRYELDADTVDDTDPSSVERMTVGDAFRQIRHKMLFVFDYGDEWRFVVEFTGFGHMVSGTQYPKVVASVGKAPEQYRDPRQGEPPPTRRSSA
jgi:hypothetical protein